MVSPDHPSVLTPGAPGGEVKFQVRRSKGYEGLASSPDGSKLYALLEGALWDETAKAAEQLDGKQYLRVLEFDVASEQWRNAEPNPRPTPEPDRNAWALRAWIR